MTVSNGTYYLVDAAESSGTWLNGKRVAAGAQTQLHPGDIVSFGAVDSDTCVKFQVKMMHNTQRDAGLVSSRSDGSEYRLPVSFRESRVPATV